MASTAIAGQFAAAQPQQMNQGHVQRWAMGLDHRHLLLKIVLDAPLRRQHFHLRRRLVDRGRQVDRSTRLQIAAQAANVGQGAHQFAGFSCHGGDTLEMTARFLVEPVVQLPFDKIRQAANGDKLIPQFVTEGLLIASQELFEKIEAPTPGFRVGAPGECVRHNTS